jgi:hypothetical protein
MLLGERCFQTVQFRRFGMKLNLAAETGKYDAFVLDSSSSRKSIRRRLTLQTRQSGVDNAVWCRPDGSPVPGRRSTAAETHENDAANL